MRRVIIARQVRAAAVVGCGGAKLPRSTVRQAGTVPARLLYTGCLFRACYRWADRNCHPVVILSARFGAVLPSEPLPWYNRRIDELDPTALKEWAEAARRRVLELTQGVPLIGLAGADYLDALALPCVRLLKGLGQGKRMAWLKGNPVLTEGMLK